MNTVRSTTSKPSIELREEEAGGAEVPQMLPALAPVLARLPERQRLAIFLRY